MPAGDSASFSPPPPFRLNSRCLQIKDFACDMNVRRSKDSNTAIHCAAYYGHDETVKVLKELGADTSLVNKFGEQPLEVR